MKFPVILLSRPSLSQNIGAVARAMLNFGFHELRLIDPRADHLNADARALCADADAVLEQAKVFEDLSQAAFDLQYLYAATARPRDMIKEVATPREVAAKAYAQTQGDMRVGFVFGSEKSGLDNEEVAFCQEILTIPLNPEFSSINLAQSVILSCYEYYQKHTSTPDTRWQQDPLLDPIATRAEVSGYLDQLDDALMKAGYYRHQEKSPLMRRNLRNIFANMLLTQQQVRSLRGVVSSFEYAMEQKVTLKQEDSK